MRIFLAVDRGEVGKRSVPALVTKGHHVVGMVYSPKGGLGEVDGRRTNRRKWTRCRRPSGKPWPALIRKASSTR